MPDLKSEMAKVLQAWEDPTITQGTKRITTNSTRRTFNFVRDNPGLTKAQAVAALAKEGVLSNSSTSLLSTFIINGNVRESNGLLYANQAEYTPLPRPTAKPMRKRHDTAPVGIDTLVKSSEPVAATTPDVRSMIATMNVMQAREMYDELKTIFGG